MKSLVSLLTVLIFSTGVFAQILNENWVVLSSPENDFIFSMPPNFLTDIYDENYRIYGSIESSFFEVEIQKTDGGKEKIKIMRQVPPMNEVRSFTNGDFIGDLYIFESEKTLSYTTYFASSKGFYRVKASAKSDKKKVIENFFRLIKLDGNPLIKQENAISAVSDSVISVSNLKTSKEVSQALLVKDAPKTAVVYESNVTKSVDEDDREFSRPLIILRKPVPSYVGLGIEKKISDSVKLKVQFLASGKIGEIKITQGLNKNLDKATTDAVRKIKFLPAQIAGNPVDVWQFMEFNITIF